MTSADISIDAQVNPIRIEEAPELTSQAAVSDHNRRPLLDTFKGFFHRNADTSVVNRSQEVQSESDLTKQIRVFDRAVSMLKKVREPEFAGGIAAGAIGALGIITGSGELGFVALVTGGAAVGAGFGETPKQRILGALTGAAVGAGAIEVVNNLPANHNAIAAGLSVADDALPIAAGIAGVVANAVRENKSQPVGIKV
jgi:hypothetical protein